MKALAIAVALLLGAGAAQAQDCGLKQFDSIPLEVYPDHLLLPVSFAGTPEKMVLRLEDAANGISADAAKTLDMSLRSMPPHLKYHRDGQDIDHYARATDVRLGRMTMDTLEFLVVRAQRYRDGVVGDIGTHMFEKMDFELDLGAARFNLFSPEHCPGKVVYWTKDGFARLPLKSSPDFGFVRTDMVLDGHPVTVGISTTGQSRIGMNAMRRVFGVDETSPNLVLVEQDLMGRKTYRYAFKSLAADGLAVSNPAILVYDEEPRPECNDKLHFAPPPDDERAGHFDEKPRLARCFGADDVVLGLSVLRKLHIYVSGKEKLQYLTAAEAH